MIEDLQDTEVGDSISDSFEHKKLYNFSEALNLMMNQDVEMRCVSSFHVKHRCAKSNGGPKQMERSYDSEWMNIDYYHWSEIEGEWEVV